MDCLYGANHVPLGQISDEILPFPYGYMEKWTLAHKSDKVGHSDQIIKGS